MTDLERARWAIRGEPETWVNMIVMHLAAARREGAEAARAENAVHIHIAYDNGVQNGKLAGAEGMRERAAQTMQDEFGDDLAAAAIRSLSLTPEEPA